MHPWYKSPMALWEVGGLDIPIASDFTSKGAHSGQFNAPDMMRHNCSTSLLAAHSQYGPCNNSNHNEIHNYYENKRDVLLSAMSAEQCRYCHAENRHPYPETDYSSSR
jgi:hypothetical protein